MRNAMNPILLRTDISACFDAKGETTACPGSGRDAAYGVLDQRGRFTVDGPLVHDALTGAVWLRDANPESFPLTWEEARAVTARMTAQKAHGLGDWQLPTRRALFSLVSHDAVNPSLPSGHPFTNVFTGYYWTSESCNRLPAQAWHIHLGGGRVVKANKTDASLVWPVCLPVTGAGALPPAARAARFAPERGLALDTLTGLYWSLDADAARRPLRWEEAIAFVEELNAKNWLGCADWRLPNVRELESLADLSADSPALAPGHPFTGVREGYWSSTTSIYEPRYAWTLYTRDGMVGVGFKADPEFYCWPVRGGLEFNPSSK